MIVPGVNPPPSSESDEARRPTTEGFGLRRAAEAIEGDASPVGICDTEDSACPHQAQAAAPSSTSDEQLAQRIKLWGNAIAGTPVSFAA